MHMQTKAAHLLIIITLFSVVGCEQQFTNTQATESPVIAEGIIFSLEYKLEGGGTGGITRMNTAKGVPGGNGSWNVDAKGQLTNHYLIITYPQKQGLGPRIIPARRLVDIQFGDGGIKTVNESEPAPSN